LLFSLKVAIDKALLPSKAKTISKATLNVVNKAIVAPDVALLVLAAAASYRLLSCANVPIIAS
jgi:hypothetical protein